MRRSYSTESVLVSFAARVVVNFGLIIVLQVFWDADLVLGDVLFFLFLFSVLITLYDRYRPVHEYRFHAGDRAEDGPASAT